MRRAKKVFLAFFFSALMIWQGFFFAKAEGESPFVLPEMEPVITDMEKDSKSYYTKAVGFSKEAVDDNIYELWDSDGNPHFVVEYRIAFHAKSINGRNNKDCYRQLVINDTLASGELDYFDPLNKYPGFSFDYEMDRFQPSFRRGVWRSGELRLGEDGVKYFEAAADDEENHGSIFALRADESGEHAVEEADAYLDYGNSDGRTGTLQYDLGQLGENE